MSLSSTILADVNGGLAALGLATAPDVNTTAAHVDTTGSWSGGDATQSWADANKPLLKPKKTVTTVAKGGKPAPLATSPAGKTGPNWLAVAGVVFAIALGIGLLVWAAGGKK